MPSTPKSNKLKRKRGKKFVRYGDKQAEITQDTNPFEEHSRVKNGVKDLEKRKGLIEEYRKLGKNSSIIDNRIAEKSSRLSEEDKMKLRYIAEQKERAKMHLKTSKKRTKFHLDSDDSDQEVFLGGFTHRGKQIQDEDDFNE